MPLEASNISVLRSSLAYCVCEETSFNRREIDQANSLVDKVRIMCADDVAKKLDVVPLCNDTVRRRIASMSFNVKEQLVSSIKQGGEYSL